MQAILRFDLSDIDDAYSHRQCVKASHMALAMWSFEQELKNLVDRSEDGMMLNEKNVWEAWRDCLEQYDIRLEHLVL
jgi:hypothetical protein